MTLLAELKKTSGLSKGSKLLSIAGCLLLFVRPLPLTITTQDKLSIPFNTVTKPRLSNFLKAIPFGTVVNAFRAKLVARGATRQAILFRLLEPCLSKQASLSKANRVKSNWP